MSYEQNTLDLVPVIFAAGESKMFNMSGNYFELIDCPDPVDVVLSDAVGGQRVRMKQGEASFYSKGVSFSVVQITSATAQTVRFIYGTGEAGTRRSTGSVVISGDVALNAATLAALEQTNERPEDSTGAYSVAAALAANTAVQVFSAASNPNGAIVYVAGCSTDATTGDPAVTLISKATAPANVHDGFVWLRNESKSQGTSWQSYSATLPQRIKVPAGHGLFWIAAQITPAASYRHCTYKLL